MFGKGKFGVSLVLGLLALPLAGAAATALVATNRTEPAPVPVSVPVTRTDALQVGATVTNTSHATAPVDSAADLERACGEAGLALVDRESRNELSELETAALTALRDVCESEGVPLPGPPAPEPVIQTVTVEASGPVTTAPSSVGDDHDEDDEYDEHDEYEDDEHEEHDGDD